MAKKIFINLPVADPQKSMDFYSQIGFINNPTYTDNFVACMVLTNEVYLMLIAQSKFKEFLSKEIADTKTFAAVINSISVDNIETVNKITDYALAAGGKETATPTDYGFMQLRSFEDIDGHLWEVLFIDENKIPSE